MENTLKKALEAATAAGYLYVTDRGTNADNELWCIDLCGEHWDLDVDDDENGNTYGYFAGKITEYDKDDIPTGWYLECGNDETYFYEVWPPESDDPLRYDDADAAKDAANEIAGKLEDDHSRVEVYRRRKDSAERNEAGDRVAVCYRNRQIDME